MSTSPVFIVFNLTVIDLIVLAFWKISSCVKKVDSDFFSTPGFNLCLCWMTSLVSVLLEYRSMIITNRIQINSRAISVLKISDCPLAQVVKVAELIVETVKELKNMNT
jgi:hypothetical protein